MKKFPTCHLVSVLIAVWSVSVCATDHVKPDETGMKAKPREEIVLKIAVNENGKASLTDSKTGKTKGISPYLMTTDDEGNIVMINLEGHVLQPAELTSLGRPTKANPITKVEDLTAISILRATGSHFEIVCTPNGCFLLPLPH